MAIIVVTVLEGVVVTLTVIKDEEMAVEVIKVVEVVTAAGVPVVFEK